MTSVRGPPGGCEGGPPDTPEGLEGLDWPDARVASGPPAAPPPEGAPDEGPESGPEGGPAGGPDAPDGGTPDPELGPEPDPDGDPEDGPDGGCDGGPDGGSDGGSDGGWEFTACLPQLVSPAASLSGPYARPQPLRGRHLAHRQLAGARPVPEAGGARLGTGPVTAPHTRQESACIRVTTPGPTQAPAPDVPGPARAPAPDVPGPTPWRPPPPRCWP
ncbi:hypothetical protein GCM10010193_15170 [Kitasatospora atroaurantiaca]